MGVARLQFRETTYVVLRELLSRLANTYVLRALDQSLQAPNRIPIMVTTREIKLVDLPKLTESQVSAREWCSTVKRISAQCLPSKSLPRTVNPGRVRDLYINTTKAAKVYAASRTKRP